MEKQVFASPDGAPAVGPYSPAVGAGDFVFVSGQIPLDPDGKIVGYTPKDQARKALENLRATLQAAGLDARARRQDDRLPQGHGRVRAPSTRCTASSSRSRTRRAPR